MLVVTLMGDRPAQQEPAELSTEPLGESASCVEDPVTFLIPGTDQFLVTEQAAADRIPGEVRTSRLVVRQD